MINKFTSLVLLTLFLPLGFAYAQTPLTGKKITLDPGHGGHDSDDRQTDVGLPVYYWESDANWIAIGYLDSMLRKLGADVKITKTTNDPAAPDRDPSLSDRVQVSNAFGSNYFHSFHTNGSANKTVNYSLVLYAGPSDGNADNPLALQMAEIMDDEIFIPMRTTSTSARADIPFTGFTNGLGVLNNLNAPGTLSEASFHSNTNEGRRLLNPYYLKAASWAILKSFLEFYNLPQLTTGEIGGIVTDVNNVPINGITVKVNPGQPNELVYNGDQYLNGYYLFDWLPAGTYEVEFSKFGYVSKTLQINVSAGQYTETDVQLTGENDPPSVPKLQFTGPVGETGIEAQWIANTESNLLGYRLYWATDDNLQQWFLVADESTLTAETTSVSLSSKNDFKVIPETSVTHYKLTSVAQSGAESEAGIIMSSWGSGTDKILIVDGFDRRTGSYTSANHTFFPLYTRAIRDSRLATISNTFNDRIISGDVNLSDYDMVLWFLGDESTADETFSDTEQTLVKNYLENGGRLLVTGSEVAWDLANRGSATDQAFFLNYLKASYKSDGASNYTPAKGIEGTLFENLTLNFGVTYPEDFPDAVNPQGGAISILDYNVAGEKAGVAYKGTFGAGSIEGGLVYVSFPLETVVFDEMRPFVKKALDYLQVGDYFPIPPVQPVLHFAFAEAGKTGASWKANTDENLLGYRLYYATDESLASWALAADETTLKAGVESVLLASSEFKVIPVSPVHYVRLSAVAEGGFESPFSDIYALNGAETDIKVLIVDGFDRVSGSYKQPRHDFAVSHAKAILSKSDFTLATAANELIESGALNTDPYNVVFWILGDESTAQETFSAAEQAWVSDYLDRGGNLFLSGSEVGWDLWAQGSATDKSFFSTKLKAQYISDGNSNLRPAVGVAGTDFDGLNILFGETYPEDFPDEIAPGTGAIGLMKYSSGTQFSGIGFKGAYLAGNKPAALVYLAYPLETAVESDRASVVSAAIDYFGITEDVAPVTQSDVAATDSDTPVQMAILQNDYDINYDIDPSTVVISQGPASGTVALQDGVLTYTPVISFGGEVTFSYTVKDRKGLVSNSATVTVEVTSVLSTSIDSEFSVYPNPTDGYFTLTLPESIANDTQIQLHIIGMDGTIKPFTHESITENTIRVMPVGLDKGVYLLRVRWSEGQKTIKWIKN